MDELGFLIKKHPDIAYGKIFDKKAGFIHKSWFPTFANYRRNGYDFDALFEDELASYRAKKVMDVLELDDEAVGKELLSPDIKELAGFGKRSDGSKGEKGFDGTITDLQMQTYLIMSGFKQRLNKKGESYGWALALLETPETKWGYDYVISCYKENPKDSFEKIIAQIKSVLPDVGEISDADITKVLGIRYPGTEKVSVKKPKKPAKPKKTRLYLLSYPESLISSIEREMKNEDFVYTDLTDDQMKGLEYMLEWLDDRDRRMLLMRYKDHMTYGQIAEVFGVSSQRVSQILFHALMELLYPYRRLYYTEGFDAVENWFEYAKKRAKDRKTITKDMTEEEIKEILGKDAMMPLCLMNLSDRVLDRFARDRIDVLFQLVELVYMRPGTILCVEGIGMKTAEKIVGKLKDLNVEIPTDCLKKPSPKQIDEYYDMVFERWSSYFFDGFDPFSDEELWED